MTFPLRVAVAVGFTLLLLGAPGIAAADQADHEHPDEVDDGGDLRSVERWLSNEIGKRHVNCSEGLAVGSFDPCEDLDEEYESLLSEYVSVERELEGETSTAERLNETRKQQREYARLVREFNTTYEEYQEARQAGDDRRARELARELQELAARIEELGGDLDVRFRELDSDIEGNVSSASDSINESTSEVRTIATRIETESFKPTQITVDVEPRASFRSPATVSGMVTDANGSAILGGRVVVDDGEQNFTTALIWGGEFELEYRPTNTSRGFTKLDVQYFPDETTRYQGSNVTASTVVEGTPSTVDVTAMNDTVVLGERLRVVGEVRASERGVGDVPVTIAADGVVLASPRTDDSGTFTASPRLPANVSAGAVQLTATASAPDRAILPSENAALVTVGETPTDLRVAATRDGDEGEVAITGRLTTATDADAAVGERPVTVTVGDTEYNVTTDADGYFRLTHDADDATATTVTAEYDEPGSNLGANSAEASLEDESVVAAISAWLTVAADAVAEVVRSNPLLSAVVLAGVLLNIGIWGLVFYARRRGGTEDSLESPADAAESEAGDERSSEPSTDLLLDAARSHVVTDPEAAVRTGYAAVRTELDGAGDSRTHWEFYRAVRPELPEERRTSLRSITESFERAAFAAEGVDPDAAEEALEDAERCLAGS